MTAHVRRQNSECPLGGAFYKCSSEFGGFSGCCLVEPCVQGGTCPKEKDRTPGRNTPTLTTKTIVATPPSLESDMSFEILPISTIPLSLSPSATAVITSSDAAQSATHVTLLPSPSSTSAKVSGQASDKAMPIAAIAGAAVGAVVLIALGVISYLCLKRRRHKSNYQAPVYVSPYNTDSDISERPKTEIKASMRSSWHDVQQLDSSEIGMRWHTDGGSSLCFAELPAEPITRHL